MTPEGGASSRYEVKLQFLDRQTGVPLLPVEELEVCLTFQAGQLLRQQALAVGRVAQAEAQWGKAVEATALVLIEQLSVYYGAHVFWRTAGMTGWHRLVLHFPEEPR